MQHRSDSIHILHVDDESGFVDMAADFLEREDDRFVVKTATSATEGLDIVADDGIDCIVSDYDMPGQDGIEFLETIREEYPDLPFILYTGKGSEEVASEAFSAGATDYLQKDTSTDQYELLANRIRNAVSQYQSARRAAELNRIRTVANEINRVLVGADSRSTAEQRVCEILSESDPYVFAWIGEVDSETDRIAPRAWAGVEEGYLDDITVTADETATGQGPGGTAIREGRVAVSQNVQEDPEFKPWREAALQRGYQATAAVPLEYEGTLYGELAVYADRPHAFDEDEQQLLATLGVDIARAFRSFDLRAELRRNTQAMEHAPIGITISDPTQEDNPLIYTNERFEELTGYEREEILGRNSRFLQGERTGSEPVARMRKAIDARESVNVELRNYRKDGTGFWNRVTISPVEDEDGKVTNFIGFQEDITEQKEREQELERERDRFEALYQAIPEPVVSAEITDDGNIVRDVNDAFKDTFGYETAEAVGEDINDLIVPEEASIRSKAKQIDERAKAGEPLTREVRRETPDGIRDFLFRSAPIEQDSERTLQYGVYVDITEQKERQRRLETLTDSLPGMVYQCHNKRGWPMESVEGEVESLTGYTPTELERQDGIYGDEIIHPDDREDVWTAVQESLDANESFELTYRIRTKEGDLKWVWERGQAVSSESGDVQKLEGFITDITERKERKQRLQQQKRKIEALHDVAQDIETCETAEAVYERTVDAAESILEFDLAIADEATDSRLVPKAVSSPISDEQYYDETPIDAEGNLAARAYRTGESDLVANLQTYEVAPADPEFRSALTIPIGDHGVFQAVAETANTFDEDDLELAELLVSHTESALDRLTHEQRLQRQNDRLEEFVNVVSHDLRNPLNAAQGYVDLASEDCDSPHLADAEEAIDRSLTLIDNLLRIAHSGEQVSDVEAVALGDLVKDCWQAVETTNATLRIETEQTILAESSRLKQLLENLIGNAVEHSSEEVTVTVGDLAEKDGFYVADNGSGIPEEERDDIFDVGYSTAGDGTGFGLNIVRKIVDAHDWEITVTESETGGTRFEISGVDTPS